MKKVLLFIVSEDWYFVSHRLPLALAAQKEGYEVYLLTNITEHSNTFREYGITAVQHDVDRGGLNPFKDIRTVFIFNRIVKRIDPDIVHCVALKPVIFFGLTRRRKKLRCINALAGLGYIYTSRNLKAKFLRPLVTMLLRYVLRRRHSTVIVQNRDDCMVVRDHLGVSGDALEIVRGSGVDTGLYSYRKEPDTVPRIVFVARMLKDKGLLELIDACMRLRRKNIEFQLVLAGDVDTRNPASVSEEQLREWAEQPFITWLGKVKDIVALWHESHLCVLPSYREGLPKALLEAASCGRAIVTTDTPGCRDVVVDGENGLLVPVRDAGKLAQAMEKLLCDKALREKMGERGRERVLKYFDERIVVGQTLALYERMLQH